MSRKAYYLIKLQNNHGSNEINIKEFKKINLEGGYLIDGFPSVGFSSAQISTESMIQTSQFELGGIIDSKIFPPISVIKKVNQIIHQEFSLMKI
ncbi:MAG: hypothetical protein CM1200mP11_4900 [Nitrosopumilaceae archaeon]|nr:MAG: hypothetical protein CM1200mP11_4900 [Nitrosopumilaceae archaeon]